MAYLVSSEHLPIDIQREVTKAIVWGYNDCRDTPGVWRWIPLAAEEDPPLSLNKVLHWILLPTSFMRGYREQQRCYSAPIRGQQPTIIQLPACACSLSLESSNTSWSYQTAPADTSNTLCWESDCTGMIAKWVERYSQGCLRTSGAGGSTSVNSKS